MYLRSLNRRRLAKQTNRRVQLITQKLVTLGISAHKCQCRTRQPPVNDRRRLISPLRYRTHLIRLLEIALSDDNGTQPNSREQLTVEICCGHCGQCGSAVWEDRVGSGGFEGHKRRLVNLSAGFHAENGRTQSGAPLIVCDVCDNFEMKETANVLH